MLSHPRYAKCLCSTIKYWGIDHQLYKLDGSNFYAFQICTQRTSSFGVSDALVGPCLVHLSQSNRNFVDYCAGLDKVKDSFQRLL